MPRHSVSQDEDIIFEDLHGVSDLDNSTVSVDLDDDDPKSAITRTRLSPEDGERTGDDDDDDTRGRTATDDDDDGGRDDEGQDRFSKKFQNRLKREQRQKRKERQRAEEAEAEAARLRDQLQRQKRTGGDDKGKQFDSQIESVEADLEQAIEDGDSKKQARLTSQLTDLKAEKIAARYTSDDDDDDDLDDGRSQRRPPQRNELAEDWIDKHADWYGERGYGRATRLAKKIDRELYSEGYDPQDDEYYDELDARLQEQIPELFDEDGNPDPDGMDARKGRRQSRRKDNSESRDEKRSRSTVASADDASRDSQRDRKSTSNKVELGQEDFANMRRFGLDPSDPEQVREYALNKRQAEMEE